MKKFSSLGEVKIEVGSILIGKAPHVGKHAYLHEIYAPLASNDISLIEKKLKRKIPDFLKAFYLECNGLKYFSDVLSLDGYRKRVGRDVTDAYQPYDLSISNTDERIEDANDDIFFFGGYDWDGSRLYVTHDRERVYFCGPESVTPLKEWMNIEEFIFEESKRIAKLFNNKGEEINSDASTLPIK